MSCQLQLTQLEEIWNNKFVHVHQGPLHHPRVQGSHLPLNVVLQLVQGTRYWAVDLWWQESPNKEVQGFRSGVMAGQSLPLMYFLDTTLSSSSLSRKELDPGLAWLGNDKHIFCRGADRRHSGISQLVAPGNLIRKSWTRSRANFLLLFLLSYSNAR